MPTGDRWSEDLAAVLLGVAQGDFSVRMSRTGRRDRSDGIAFLVNSMAHEVERLFREVARERDFIAAVLKSMPDALFVVDAQGRIQTVNQPASTLLERSVDSLVGTRLSTLAAREDHQTQLVKMVQTLTRGDVHSVAEVDFVGPNGTTLPVAIHGRALAAIDRDSRAAVLIARDVRETRRLLAAESRAAEDARHRALELAAAKREAEKANSAKSAFLAAMSHEIRTPLTAIVGIVDILTESGLPPNESAEWFGDLKENADQLLSLVNAILDLSKIEADEITPSFVQYPVGDVVDAAVAALKARARQKGLNFGVNVDGNVPQVIRTDPLRLRQVIINLVDNAIKFTETGGITVQVGIESTPGSEERALLITVSDTGIGIPADRTADLFEPFTQVGNCSTAHRGTGLGLCISQRLARLLGGEITVSTEVGKGSRFTFRQRIGAPKETLPASPDPGAGPATAVQEAAPTPLEGVRVLLVEDTSATQRILRFFLEKAGADVRLAKDGLAAVQEVLESESAETPYDVVLMDIQMPVMDGYEATATLRDRGITTPIIALTAHAMKDDGERCLRAGCNSYLSKPISEHLLLAKLSEELGVGDRTPASNAASCACGPDHPVLVAQSRDFASQAPMLVASLEAAHRADDVGLLSKLVHQNGGLAGFLGLAEVSEAALRVAETLRSQGSVEERERPLNALVDALRALCAAHG